KSISLIPRPTKSCTHSDNDHSISHKHTEYKLQKYMRKGVSEQACENRRTCETFSKDLIYLGVSGVSMCAIKPDMKLLLLCIVNAAYTCYTSYTYDVSFSQTLLAYQDKNEREQFYVLLLLMYPMPCVLACLVIFGFVMSHTCPYVTLSFAPVFMFCRKTEEIFYSENV
uniref:Uncharacterized protein n=1 Tax=Glossina palpalis gambiensis TaxID=67801 RepID=A0A1B0AS13_9MUSC